MKLGSVGRTVTSNATAGALDLFNWFKDMPLLGVTSKTQAKLAARAGAIKGAFSPDAKAAKEVLDSRVAAISGDKGILDDIAKSYNAKNNLAGDTAISREGIAKEINNAYGLGGDERASALSGIASKYGIGEDAMGSINETMRMSQKLADTYWDAAKAPFGMVKDYFLDGSPLAMYAKGATAITAAQMIGGSRTSLTEKNGQRDIAGIPFV